MEYGGFLYLFPETNPLMIWWWDSVYFGKSVLVNPILLLPTRNTPLNLNRLMFRCNMSGGSYVPLAEMKIIMILGYSWAVTPGHVVTPALYLDNSPSARCLGWMTTDPIAMATKKHGPLLDYGSILGYFKHSTYFSAEIQQPRDLVLSKNETQNCCTT